MPEVGPDIATFLKANQNLRAFGYAARKVSKTWVQTLSHKRAYGRTNGNALMTRMITAAGPQGIPMWTATPALEIVTDDHGVAVGARIGGEHAGLVRAPARRW